MRGGRAQDFDPVLAAFRLIDRDHSGSITEDEVMAVVARLPDIGTVRPSRCCQRCTSTAGGRVPCHTAALLCSWRRRTATW